MFFPAYLRLGAVGLTFIVTAGLPVSAQQAALQNRGRVPIERRVWPASVEVPMNSLDITVVDEKSAQKNYVYRTKAFEFVSGDKLAGSVMREIARTFEATRLLVQALPWGVEPRPPADIGFFRAKLYVTRQDYIADGGMENSGGCYSSKDRIFRIPFPSLGLQQRASTWYRQPGFKELALVHEVTHQMMHEFLPFLPSWVIEGTAEYTETLPYSAGKFSAAYYEHGLRSYIKRWREHGVLSPQLSSVGRMMSMRRPDWNTMAETPQQQALLYYQSYMLVYYFCHLDGDGKGTRFLKYLDAVAKARDEWDLFFKNPNVKRTGSRFTYPRSLKLPDAKRSEEFGIEKLDILFDGRSPAEMNAAVKAGFRKINVNL